MVDKKKDAEARLSSPVGSQAVALYAIGARDPTDFIDLVNDEENVEVLQLLHGMLVEPNAAPDHDAELNKMLAPIVARVLETRGYEYATWRSRNGKA